MTTRYEGPGRRGADRALTDIERAQWAEISGQWNSTPPWTEEVRARNAEIQQALVDLYEDGVSLPTLAEAAGWNRPQAAGVLHRARVAGMGTGSRRFIPRPEKPARASFRRPLSEQEAADLSRMYEALPLHSGGNARGWNGKAGAVLVAAILSLREDRVALGTIGEHLGMSRQAVHSQIAKAEREQAA